MDKKTRVVINPVDDGLRLSTRALNLGARLSGDRGWGRLAKADRSDGFRHDPTLLEVIDLLGENACDGGFLRIHDVPGKFYQIVVDGPGEVLVIHPDNPVLISVDASVSESAKPSRKRVVNSLGRDIWLSPLGIRVGRRLSGDPQWFTLWKDDELTEPRMPNTQGVRDDDEILVGVVELLGELAYCQNVDTLDVRDVSPYRVEFIYEGLRQNFVDGKDYN